MNEKYSVYLVSDSTGETLDRIFLSLKSQFANFDYEKKEFVFVRTEQQVDRILNEAGKTINPILLYTIVETKLAKILSKKYSVLVLDKARGPGGRSSNKRFQKNLSFDHGVQYISPKSKSFKKFLENLRRRNIVKIWDGEHLDFTFEKKEFNKKYIGKHQTK